jgi:hypothetical protein
MDEAMKQYRTAEEQLKEKSTSDPAAADLTDLIDDRVTGGFPHRYHPSKPVKRPCF